MLNPPKFSDEKGEQNQYAIFYSVTIQSNTLIQLLRNFIKKNELWKKGCKLDHD